MASTVETEVREFAAKFSHLPSAQRMITLCETGRITWGEAHAVATNALAAGLSAVSA